jgi:ribonuclease H2 subunit B
MKEAEAKTVADSKKRKGLAKVSQGVERLKKVNTVGMAKLSSFFQKATK